MLWYFCTYVLANSEYLIFSFISNTYHFLVMKIFKISFASCFGLYDTILLTTNTLCVVPLWLWLCIHSAASSHPPLLSLLSLWSALWFHELRHYTFQCE
jgi:hypothetical protein